MATVFVAGESSENNGQTSPLPKKSTQSQLPLGRHIIILAAQRGQLVASWSVIFIVSSWHNLGIDVMYGVRPDILQ